MTNELDNYYLKHPEPIQGCLLALRDFILSVNKDITHIRRYQIPFFYYKDKQLAFLWVTRKKLLLGLIEDKNIHPKMEGVKLKDKIQTIEIDPTIDLPIDTILGNLHTLIRLYDKL